MPGAKLVVVPALTAPRQGGRANLGNSRSMADHDDANGSGAETPDSVAHYIGGLMPELARMARRNGLDTLGYILEMAALEADQNAKG